jgi:biotin carboxyl carrier protein
MRRRSRCWRRCVERAEDQRVRTTSESAITAPFAGTVVAIAHEPDERVEASTAL